MTNLQSRMLIIAKEFIRICELLKINYFVAGGTCIGAVRHSGFIPWDDDMDFYMPRKDYEIFRKIGVPLLSKNFFFQDWKSEKHWNTWFAKIRDSNTTAIEKELYNLDINHGVWIDIFPLDGLPCDKEKMDIYRRRFYRLFNLRIWHKDIESFSIAKALWIIFLFLLFPSKKIALMVQEKVQKKYSFEKSVFLWENFSIITKDQEILKREWFEGFYLFQFEDIVVRVPIGYDYYLSHYYGDYMTPPSKKQGSHNFLIVDISKSYTLYLKK